MGEEERLTCPHCGAPISKSDSFCKNCGVNLEVWASNLPFSEAQSETPYSRRFSLSQRLCKIIYSPREVVKDIALVPDYEGVFLLLIFEGIISLVSIFLAFQKIQFVGEYASRLGFLVSGILAFSAVLSFVIVFVRWLIKSLIVRYVFGGGEVWDFKTAAVVTGYAYVADVIISFVGLFIVWFFFPSVTINVSSAEAAMQSMAEWQGKLNWLQFLYTLPTSVFALIWKSYLGGLGVEFGTREKYRFVGGFLVFLALGSIGLLFLLFIR